MGLRALRFLIRPGNRGPLRSSIETAELRRVKEARARELPFAWVVRNEDVEQLAALEDLVVDRGTKNPAKGLATLLLGYSRIPVIRGSHTVVGQLERSVLTLLVNAANEQDRNVYIIGAGEDVFDELWERAEEDSPPPATPRVHPEAPRPAPFPQGGGTGSPPPGLLRLLPGQEVPRRLAEMYLGESEQAQLVRRLILRAAGHAEPVLVQGEAGTGKEVVARAIHRFSGRPVESFTLVNCAAIPREQFASELFGHCRGAAPGGGEDREGLWEAAGKGTLFLDEIGDLAPEHQAEVAMALRQGTMRPAGATEPVRVAARVIAATTRDLFALVQTRQFREDLYYALRGFVVPTPPLRDHREDVPLLAQAFWRKITHDESSELPGDVLAELAATPWPGNAHELKAVLMYLHCLFGKDNLGVNQLRGLLAFQGRSGRGEAAASEGQLDPRRVRCLQHLRLTIDVVRACEMAVEPLVEEGRTDEGTVASARARIGRHLEELQLLCLQPQRFPSPDMFGAVHEFQGRLLYFTSLLDTDAASALDYWAESLQDQFTTLAEAIAREVQDLCRPT